MLLLADKLSNMRSIAHDYEKIGDELWKRFNAPKEKQAWYYGGLQDALFSMQLYPECAQSYWEFVSRYKDVFVHFYHDKEKEIFTKAAQYNLLKNDSGDIKPLTVEDITDAEQIESLRQLAKEENEMLDGFDLPEHKGYWGRLYNAVQARDLEMQIHHLESDLKNQIDAPKHYQARYKSWFDALENLPEIHRNFDYIGNKFREEYLPHRPQSEIDRIYKEYLKSIDKDEWDLLLPDQRNELSKRLKSDHENYFFNVYLPQYKKLQALRNQLKEIQGK
jgi:hypothetical protein